MSIYGEGKYVCAKCGEAAPPPRSNEQLRDKHWETTASECGRELTPVATR